MAKVSKKVRGKDRKRARKSTNKQRKWVKKLLLWFKKALRLMSPGNITVNVITESASKDTPTPSVAMATRPGFKYAGKTLKRKDGSWIRIEKDGTTITCPTRCKSGEIVEQSYPITNATQIAFLTPLLEIFSSGDWYKPVQNKSVWGNTWFSSGIGKQFLDDGHISYWQALDGHNHKGRRGSIRLSVAA